MRDPKAVALFQEILKKTEAGKLAWDTTPEEDTFAAIMLGRLTLTLLPYTTETALAERVGPPSVKLDDERGNTIVRIDSNIEGVREEELQQLLVFARRIALNADAKIDELLEELQRPELTIISAKYGARDSWHDVTSKLRAKIQYERLRLNVNNAELGTDPAPNVLKSLEVKYAVATQGPQSKTVPEGEWLTLP